MAWVVITGPGLDNVEIIMPRVLGITGGSVIFRAYQPFSPVGLMTTIMHESVHSEWEMLALFEMTPDLVCIAGEDGYFKKVNRAVIETLQYSPEEIYSRLISSFIHPDDREFTSRERNLLLQGQPLLNFQNRYLTRNGETVWLEWTSVYLPQKKIVFAIAKNITVSKKREKEFADKYNTYKNLAHHFKNRAEEDRKYLAFELHEEVAQLAASLKIQLNLLQQYTTTIPAVASVKIEEIITIADMLVKAIRRITFSISPAMLDDLGFNDTMEWVCREFAALNGVTCHYLCDGVEDAMNKDQKTDLFRICQHALRSIAEQEDYSSVTIHLENTGEFSALHISSDGCLLNAEESLQDIHQLAATMNASLAVDAGSGKETTISVLVKKDEKISGNRNGVLRNSNKPG